MNWQAQALAQDWVNIFVITPCLVATSVFTYRKYENAARLWAGVNLYLAYTFAIYCFNVHFNGLFLVYCCCLGLSVFSFLYFLVVQMKSAKVKHVKKRSVNNVTAIYLLLIAIAFYFLWLSEIIPSITNGTTPQTLVDTGLFTNAVQVMDISILLPVIFITGIFLKRGNPLAILFAAVILTFFVLMDITIAVIVITMKLMNVESEIIVAIVMFILAAFSAILLIKQLENNKTTSI